MTQSFNLDKWLEQNLFNELPLAIAIIDPEFNVIKANQSYAQTFGNWQNKKCYEVYKNLGSPCAQCKNKSVFKDGKSRVREVTSIGKNGEKVCRIRKTMPIISDDGSIPYLIETTTDIMAAKMIRQKYRNLFEHVPCDVMIINRDFKILEANKRKHDVFGNIEGSYCYQILKSRNSKCNDCTAKMTFEDGQLHSGRSTVINKDGKRIDLLVTTVPFEAKNGNFDHVMEMAVDITETLALQEELKRMNNTLNSLIASSLYGIIAVDERNNISVLNQAAREMLKISDEYEFSVSDMENVFPKKFLESVLNSEKQIYLRETDIRDLNGDSFPVRLTGINLVANSNCNSRAIWINDIREYKKLEGEKLEAERMAAVGKTVAGLAHGIKNVLTGLEGGEYMLSSGLKKANEERIQKGMNMLSRNTKRVSTFVKEFLNFSKGEEIEVNLCDPLDLAREIVSNFALSVDKLGINLLIDFQEHIAPAAIDSEGMLECLSNILANAIDACRISESTHQLQIDFRVYEQDEAIIYEVRDNGCGMDYEVKRKVFTTFFTTKGLGGTGLGLLMTQKIIQQHGGEVQFDSMPDQGTTFKIILPRRCLPKLINIIDESDIELNQ